MDNLDDVLRLTGRPLFTHRLGRTRNYHGWTTAAEARINDIELTLSQGGGPSTSGTGTGAGSSA
eukprot:3064869-Alexandrium_andersonii.AAC.1